VGIQFSAAAYSTRGIQVTLLHLSALTDHRALDAAVWAMPMLHFNGMRSAVMQSGLINLKE
jgi:hypothetical protein